MVWVYLVTLAVGVLFGYVVPGRTNKSRLFWIGIVAGILWAAAIELLEALALPGITGGFAAAGFFGIILTVVLLLVVFLIGVWLGDKLEGAAKPVRA